MQWEDKLRAVEQLEREYEGWRHRQQLVLDEVDRDQLLALAQDLPRVWSAPTTTAAERKQLLRLLIDSVLLDNHRLVGRTWFQINWRTGASTEHSRVRRVRGYFDYAALEDLMRRIRELHATQLMDAAIASSLNEEGFRTSHGQRFSGPMIHLLRRRWDLPTWNPTSPGPPRWPDGTYSVASNERSLQGDRHHDRFGDPMTTMAAIDRVVHHSVILDLMGMDSYRAREAARKACPLNARVDRVCLLPAHWSELEA